MLGRKSVLLALLATAAALVSAPGVAMAQPATSAPADQITAAVSRITANHYSAADLALVKSKPEVARQVPDPAGPSVAVLSSATMTLAKDGTVPGGKAPTGAQAAGVENCAGAAELWITQTSMLGNIIWRWSHKVEACSDDVNVTRFLRRNDFLVIADGTIQFKEITLDVEGATPRQWTSSTRQRHLEQCFALPLTGCFHQYPWSRIILFANHTWTYEWGV